jgi:hypothetical protein
MKRIPSDSSIRISAVGARNGDPMHFVQVRSQLNALLAEGYDRIICVLRQGDFVVIGALASGEKVVMLTPDQRVMPIPQMSDS